MTQDKDFNKEMELWFKHHAIAIKANKQEIRHLEEEIIISKQQLALAVKSLALLELNHSESAEIYPEIYKKSLK
jgi:hypothetical protein